jgi:hypothetical protein
MSSALLFPTSLRKIKIAYPEQIPSCHHGSDNPWGICSPSLHLHPNRPSTTSVRCSTTSSPPRPRHHPLSPQ